MITGAQAALATPVDCAAARAAALVSGGLPAAVGRGILGLGTAAHHTSSRFTPGPAGPRRLRMMPLLGAEPRSSLLLVAIRHGQSTLLVGSVDQSGRQRAPDSDSPARSIRIKVCESLYPILRPRRIACLSGRQPIVFNGQVRFSLRRGQCSESSKWF